MNPAEEPRKRGLGRGLSALLGDPMSSAAGGDGAVRLLEDGAARLLPVEQLQAGRMQPRHHFDQDSIDELTQSVREKGIIQPLLVRPLTDGLFEIIAGERRWRAAQAAGLHEVPAIVHILDDRAALELALIENLQRQDLSPLEEADGFRRLLDEYSHTQEELARVLGKSRSHVANMMRLLGLPDAVKLMLQQGALSAGHARALLTSSDPVGLANQVVAQGLNVRQTEKLAQRKDGVPHGGKNPATADKDTDLMALEHSLSNLIGLRVTIQGRALGGTLSIHYNSLDQLDDVIARLSAERSSPFPD